MALQTTTPSLLTGTILHTIAALSLPLQGLTDQGGRAFSPSFQVRAAFADLTPTYPSLVVDYRPGESEEGMGQNLIGYDAAAQVFRFGQYDDGGELRLTLRTRKQAERIWLHDWFDSALRAMPVVDTPTGTVIPGAVQKALAAFGIFVTAIKRPETPPPELDDPRPVGQRWDLTLVVAVDVSLTWSEPGSVTTSQIEFSATPVLGGIRLPSDPLYVIKESP